MPHQATAGLSGPASQRMPCSPQMRALAGAGRPAHRGGEVTATPADDACVQYRTELSRSDDGVWRTTMVQTEKGACQ
ncbi:hypothetical protein ABT112_12665 [Streptomyces sp. NPDC002055]|uniref:hypothetical protein n=1 Tax=Streptomyces sp. NPDC002055 TaxID=3154534 RepID=UPI003317F797